MKASKRPSVAVVYKSMPQYRRQFFNLLKERLAEFGVEFVLIYGQAASKDLSKKDTVEIPWAKRITNKIFSVGSKEVYWQPCLGMLKGVDLVIVEQASKLLVNYVLLAQNVLGIRKMAFWGHGKNFQANSTRSLAEAVKRFVSTKVHWWFAYNELSARIVESLGFPKQRITLVQNAIDTRQLVDAKDKLREPELVYLRQEIGLKGNNIGIFCGGMYEEKCLEFLLKAGELIRKRVPDFEILFLGAGPDSKKVKEAAEKFPWIHYVGPKFDVNKVPYFVLSKLYLMPGLVGLGILDSFALETPLVTTDVEFHSPEIDYLLNNQNGVMVDHNVETYAETVVTLLQNEKLRSRLVAGCRRSSTQYTVEEMADRFAQGVMLALKAE